MSDREIHFRIANSVQSSIKEIVANDGEIEGANDKLKEFMEKPTGVLMLALVQDLLRSMKLKFSEHVFLQETGFDPHATYDTKVHADLLTIHRLQSENVSVVDGLLDWYEDHLEEKILLSSQLDGMVEDKVIIPDNVHRSHLSPITPILTNVVIKKRKYSRGFLFVQYKYK